MRRVGRRAAARPPASGSESASTTRRAMSSCSANRSPSDDCTVCEESERAGRRLDELRRRPELVAGAEQRAHDDAIDVGLGGERLEVGRLGGEARGGGAGAHDERGRCRTSDVAIASGRLKARKSVSGSGRSTRNGSTTRRVSAWARAGVSSPVAPRTRRSSSAIASADGGRSRGLLGERAADDAVDRGHGRGAGERGRLLVERRVQDLDDGPAGERRPARRASRTGWRPAANRSVRGVDARRPSPARAPCSAACPRRCPAAVRSVTRWRSKTAESAPGAPGRSRAASRRAA